MNRAKKYYKGLESFTKEYLLTVLDFPGEPFTYITNVMDSLQDQELYIMATLFITIGKSMIKDKAEINLYNGAVCITFLTLFTHITQNPYKENGQPKRTSHNTKTVEMPSNINQDSFDKCVLFSWIYNNIGMLYNITNIRNNYKHIPVKYTRTQFDSIKGGDNDTVLNNQDPVLEQDTTKPNIRIKKCIDTVSSKLSNPKHTCRRSLSRTKINISDSQFLSIRHLINHNNHDELETFNS